VLATPANLLFFPEGVKFSTPLLGDEDKRTPDSGEGLTRRREGHKMVDLNIVKAT
jgi:hypothetical protein